VHLFDRLTGRGAAPQADDVPAIIARVTIPTIPPARAGYTSTWDIVDVEAALPIELDERGRVLPTKRKPYLACANCPEPLRASAGVRTDDDRVWALKCGHLLDERCFKALAGAPGAAKDEAEIKANEQEEVEPSPKRRKARKAKPAPLQDHTWNCPTCSREHVSQTVGGEWKQKEGLGATQIFV
jgi:hypothetical protein